MTRSTLVCTVALVGVVVVAAATASVATAAPTGVGLLVHLQGDGSATVTLRTTYDLTTDAESRAFDELRADADSRDALVTRYRDRMASVAGTAAAETGREMRVSGGDVAFETRDGVGVVALTVEWDGLAATDDGRLVVGRPFADGFETAGSLTLVAPDGYEGGESTVSPDSRTERELTWESATELDGFEVAFVPTDGERGNDETADTDPSSGTAETGVRAPGFGVVAALTALLAAGSVARRRTRV